MYSNSGTSRPTALNCDDSHDLTSSIRAVSYLGVLPKDPVSELDGEPPTGDDGISPNLLSMATHSDITGCSLLPHPIFTCSFFGGNRLA